MTSAASLDFVPARRPEAVRMDVSKYKLINPSSNALSKRIRPKLSVNEGSASEESSSDEKDSEDSEEDEDEDSSDSMEDSERSDTEESSYDEGEDAETAQQQSLLENAKAPAKEIGVDASKRLFYDINENPNDRGSREAKRIHKSWHASARAPVGLVNRGVTCYMNSAIQALLHLPAVGRYLLEVLHGSHPKVSKASVTYDLANLFKKMMEKRSPVVPARILHRLDDINPMLDEWQQEDSHEFYMSLVSRLQEDSVPKGEKLRSSIMHDIFGGSVEQKVTCQKCQTVSTTTQDFYDLPVSFSAREENEGRYTLESSIKDFFTPEAIAVSEKGTGYQCEKCKKRTNAVKQLAIAEAPEYLTVHMKRFKMDEGISKKVKETMAYPRVMDLTQYETNPEDPLQYKLIAVIVHEGRTVSSGHYIALTLQPNNGWMMYDDELMREIPASSAESHPSAYILLYSRLLKKPGSPKAKDEPASAVQKPKPAKAVKPSKASKTTSKAQAKAKAPVKVPAKAPVKPTAKAPVKTKKANPITAKAKKAQAKTKKADAKAKTPKRVSWSPDIASPESPKLSKRKGSTDSIDDIFGKSKRLKRQSR